MILARGSGPSVGSPKGVEQPLLLEALEVDRHNVLGLAHRGAAMQRLAQDCELAHLAQLRYGAYGLHRNRSLQPFISTSMVEGEVHGPIFQNTYRLFIRRVEKTYGNEVAHPMWLDLKAFESNATNSSP